MIDGENSNSYATEHLGITFGFVGVVGTYNGRENEGDNFQEWTFIQSYISTISSYFRFECKLKIISLWAKKEKKMLKMRKMHNFETNSGAG